MLLFLGLSGHDSQQLEEAGIAFFDPGISSDKIVAFTEMISSRGYQHVIMTFGELAKKMRTQNTITQKESEYIVVIYGKPRLLRLFGIKGQ